MPEWKKKSQHGGQARRQASLLCHFQKVVWVEDEDHEERKELGVEECAEREELGAEDDN